LQAAWDIHECEMHMLDDCPVDFAYHSAYLKTLRRRGTELPMQKKERDASPILTVMPDFGSGPFLWINREGDYYRGVGGNCCDSVSRCDNHPMSDALFDAFSKWIAEFETAPWVGWASGGLDLNWPDFHTRGLALAKRLKIEVGAAFRVIYEKPAEDPAHHDHERREVLADGSVVPLPARPIGSHSIGA
jgi:hypothetical protein